MHYVMDDLEVDFLLDSVEFVARYGALFLSLYDFNLYDGAWSKKDGCVSLQKFSLESALKAARVDETPMSFDERRNRYTAYLDEALQLARKLEKREPAGSHRLEGKLGELQFFSLPNCCIDAKKAHKQMGFLNKIRSVFNN